MLFSSWPKRHLEKSVIKDALDKARNFILKQDKYLRLSYFLRKNRNDWSEGPYFAERGLDGFEIANERDQIIFDQLSDLIEDWDGDGRVFRDCTWNYEAIQSLAPAKLVAQRESVESFLRQ